MTAMDIGRDIAALCRQGKNQEAIAKHYSPNVVSVEAMAIPNLGQIQKGIQAIKDKNKRWSDNSEIHSVEVNGPFPNGDRFIIHFKYDVTTKPTGKRMLMNEMGLYTVENDKIVKEEFFYTME